jgi:hypothetical protein
MATHDDIDTMFYMWQSASEIKHHDVYSMLASALPKPD